MAITKSGVQANFAATVLRIARDSEVDVAIRLLNGLMIDLPLYDVTAEQARLHNEAISAFAALVAVLKESKPNLAAPWAQAQAATERWLAVT